MTLGESNTRAKLIDPALYSRGWTEDPIRREETAGPIGIIDRKPRKRERGRIDYTLRVKVNPDIQPVAFALIEAEAEHLPPTHRLERSKAYSSYKRLNLGFAFSRHGRLFGEYDRITGKISSPPPMNEFPTPAELRAWYEKAMGFSLAESVASPLLIKYHNGEDTRRYYQDAAFRAVFDKIARCKKAGKPRRALLSLVTGASKTFITVHFRSTHDRL